MKNQPSDILVPYQLTTEHAVEAYIERLCILSDGGPIDDLMEGIALKQALEVERQMTGNLFV